MNPYTVPDIERIFSPEQTLARWRQIEIATLRAQHEAGLVPVEWLTQAISVPAPSIADWQQQTALTRHEVVGFLQAWGVQHVHIGLTSSDLVDTGWMLALKTTNTTILADALYLSRALARRALETLDMPRLGRTHGQAAVVDTVGHRLGDLALLARRNADRIASAATAMRVGKISGPVGGHLTRAVSPAIEESVLASLGLAPMVASQILARDLLANWASALAIAVSGCEAVATEVRLGSHEAVREIYEPFAKGQVGSSAMPGKRNPIMAERLTGLSRLARSSVEPLMAGISQWHDRDLAHSSVERVLVPQLAGLASYALENTARMVTDLGIDHIQMRASLARNTPHIHHHAAMVEAQLSGTPYDLARHAKPSDEWIGPAATNERLRWALEQISS